MTDKTDSQITTEIQEISFTLNSVGWGFIEGRIKEMIDTLYDIRTVDDKLKGEEKLKEIELRQHTASLFEQLLRDVIGEKEKQANLENKKEEKNDFIQIL